MRDWLRRRAAHRLLRHYFNSFQDGESKTTADLVVEEWLWRAADEDGAAKAIRDAESLRPVG